MAYSYRVGELYSPTRRSWTEGQEYNYRAGQHEMRFFWRSPRAAEVREFKQGACEFALVVQQPVILLLFRIGNAAPDWSDAPYSIHLVSEAERVVPPPAQMAEPHAVLVIHLVDAATGILRVNRVVTWSPAFTAAMHLAIREQSALPWDAAAYDRKLAALYARYHTSRALLTLAASRTEGGR